MRVAKGQKVVFTVEGMPGRRFAGRVVAIGGRVNDRTRTVPVHAEVKNTDGLLRAQMFGQAEITVNPPQPKLSKPYLEGIVGLFLHQKLVGFDTQCI